MSKNCKKKPEEQFYYASVKSQNTKDIEMNSAGFLKYWFKKFSGVREKSSRKITCASFHVFFLQSFSI